MIITRYYGRSEYHHGRLCNSPNSTTAEPSLATSLVGLMPGETLSRQKWYNSGTLFRKFHNEKNNRWTDIMTGASLPDTILSSWIKRFARSARGEFGLATCEDSFDDSTLDLVMNNQGKSGFSPGGGTLWRGGYPDVQMKTNVISSLPIIRKREGEDGYHIEQLI